MAGSGSTVSTTRLVRTRDLPRRSSLVRTTIRSNVVEFCVTHPNDVIQKHHLSGSFYEAEELEVIEQNFTPGSVFFDVGANVGNHTLFCGIFLGPSRIIVAEPNPEAVVTLTANIRLNALDELCDTSRLGVGVGDASETGYSISWRRDRWAKRNIGGAALVRGQGEIEVVNGDDFLRGERVDFIKIDVEGMEISVLNGLFDTIAKFRPKIFVEVDNENETSANVWLSANNYVIKERVKRYSRNTNLLCVPNA